MFTENVRQISSALVLALSFFVSFHFIPQLEGQELDPKFSTFIGSVYALPIDSLPIGYQPYIEYLVPVDRIFAGKINIQERSSETAFPGLEFRKSFGIIYKSKMTVDVDGYYEFILVSDDGSRLWIEDEQIMENDFPHPMRIRRDTTLVRAGEYPIKLWYYQAYPSKYGFIFDAKYIGPPGAIADTLNWGSEILFDFDEYEINREGVSVLDSFVNYLQGKDVQQIEIIGHTDDWGVVDYNYDLSRKRAESIESYLENKKACEAIHFLSRGLGEDQPVVPNDTRENRARNRRVEIVFY